MPLTKPMDLVTNIIENILKTPGGKEVILKFDSVLKRNSGFITISKINEILEGNNVEGSREIPAHYWSKYKYVPIISCDVKMNIKCSFFAYKMLLYNAIINLSYRQWIV